MFWNMQIKRTMKPNKYDALEHCRRVIKSCKTLKQCQTANNLIYCFGLMFDYWRCFSLLEHEWNAKYDEIRGIIKLI